MSAPTGGQGKKLVFIGDSGVGKTCIISRFLKGILMTTNKQPTEPVTQVKASM